jgi:putative hydrolase of the HAD superfamily
MARGSRPRALLLDAGGVLVLPRLALLAGVLDGAVPRLDEPSVDAAHYAGIHAIDTAHEPLANRSAVYRRAFVAELGAAGPLDPARDAELAAAFRHSAMWVRPAAGAAALVRACERVGLPVVVVSNWDGTIGERLRAAGVCQEGPGPLGRVERVIDSGAVGVEKPDPRIFQLALEAVGVAPDEALHVGDSTRADVDGATGAGVGAIHLEPAGRCRDRSHRHVRDLAGLASHLGLGSFER